MVYIRLIEEEGDPEDPFSLLLLNWPEVGATRPFMKAQCLAGSHSSRDDRDCRWKATVPPDKDRLAID
jgi:hypothetical protein